MNAVPKQVNEGRTSKAPAHYNMVVHRQTFATKRAPDECAVMIGRTVAGVATSKSMHRVLTMFAAGARDSIALGVLPPPRPLEHRAKPKEKVYRWQRGVPTNNQPTTYFWCIGALGRCWWCNALVHRALGTNVSPGAYGIDIVCAQHAHLRRPSLPEFRFLSLAEQAKLLPAERRRYNARAAIQRQHAAWLKWTFKPNEATHASVIIDQQKGAPREITDTYALATAPFRNDARPSSLTAKEIQDEGEDCEVLDLTRQRLPMQRDSAPGPRDVPDVVHAMSDDEEEGSDE